MSKEYTSTDPPSCKLPIPPPFPRHTYFKAKKEDLILWQLFQRYDDEHDHTSLLTTTQFCKYMSNIFYNLQSMEVLLVKAELNVKKQIRSYCKQNNKL